MGENERLRSRLPTLTDVFRKQGVFASYALMDSSDFASGVSGGMQALRGAILRPNLIFLTLPRDTEREADLHSIISRARGNGVGVILFAMHMSAGLGLEKSINLWIHDRSPDWEMRMDMGNLDLCILLAYLLRRNWDARLNLVTIAANEAEMELAREFLRRLIELTRLPSDTGIHVGIGAFRDHLAIVPEADLNIFGMPGDLKFGDTQKFVDETRSSCMFLLASGEESALA